VRIELNQVVVSIGDRVILAAFDARFSPGLVTAIVGPSGSGKSTLLSVLAGLRKPNSGTIVYNFDDGLFRKPRVAWVPQGSNVLARRTVLDNVMVGALSSGYSLAESRRRSIESLREVGMAERSNALARELSGGELQRVGFARALASIHRLG
jgi:putative ABC transport system ATP-binding protein